MLRNSRWAGPGGIKNSPSFEGEHSKSGRLYSAGNALALDAGGAYVEALRGAINDCTHTLNVRVPTTVGSHVGVRNALAEAGSLATHVALRSHGLSPIPSKVSYNCSFLNTAGARGYAHLRQPV